MNWVGSVSFGDGRSRSFRLQAPKCDWVVTG
ncbi:hypothetical protein C8D87_104591 [Lentzea atacamensis]|uniref:Uncharacterized protein n=1 Tax=Lentzea atacamensis TaxID=531938 RepID=A0ABX9EC01_9PSEU|nr:hypothetical protein C8D87_104591 [Lentzea atacamensis]